MMMAVHVLEVEKTQPQENTQPFGLLKVGFVQVSVYFRTKAN